MWGVGMCAWADTIGSTVDIGIVVVVVITTIWAFRIYEAYITHRLFIAITVTAITIMIITIVTTTIATTMCISVIVH